MLVPFWLAVRGLGRCWEGILCVQEAHPAAVWAHRDQHENERGDVHIDRDSAGGGAVREPGGETLPDPEHHVKWLGCVCG